MSRPEAFGLIPLPVPVPWELESALGYPLGRRYLAVWWEPAGDGAVWDDGVVSTDAEWEAFLAYVQHPVVAPALAPYNLGSSDTPAVHRLLLDLEERRAYIGPAGAVARFLRADVPLSPVSPEEVVGLLARLRSASGPSLSPRAVQERMARRRQALERLVRALDRAWRAHTQN